MNITLTGFFCIFIFIALIFHNRLRLYALVTMPLSIILLRYFQFFGHYERLDLLPEVNYLLFFSFCLFLLGYTVGKRVRVKRVEYFYTDLSQSMLTDGRVFISRQCIGIYLFVTIFYCIFDLWLNAQLYGSLENALIRFYGKPTKEDFPSFLITIQGFLYKALVVFVFVYRFYLNKYNKKSTLLGITVLLLVLIAIPKGSRGAAIAPMLLLVTADFFSFTFLKGVSIRGKIKEYAVIVFLSFSLVFSLTMIRNINFEDIKDVYTAVSELNMNDAVDSYSEGEGELLLNDVQFCYTEFGNKVPFLSPFYTLETLVLAPIPRVVMSDKNVSFGYVLNGVKLWGKIAKADELVFPGAINWAAGLAGEGWANGGLFGVVFYALLFGLYSGFCSKMYYCLFKCATPISLLFGLLFFQMTFNFIRGDLLAGYVQGLYPLLIITILFYVLRYISRYKVCFNRSSVI